MAPHFVQYLLIFDVSDEELSDSRERVEQEILTPDH